MARYNQSNESVGEPVKSSLNTQLQNIETAINDTLSRKGDLPNAMEADLDMNSNQILNLPKPVANGDVVRLQDLSYNVQVAEAKYYDTMAGAQADSSLEIGDVIIVKDRANALFDVIASTTNNTYDIVDGTASSTSFQLRTESVQNVEAFGAVDGGVIDNSGAFSRILDLGIIGVLENDSTYAISSRVSWNLDSSGFISKGKSKVLMLTAGFNATTYAGLASNSVGFSANNIDNPVFKGIHIEFETHGTNIRTAIGLALRDCSNLDVDVEASGFSEPEFGIITVDSCIGGRCYTNVHDCSSNDNTLGSLQITGLEIDENRVSGVYSKDIDFGNPVYKDLTFGAAAITAFGYQTDGVTLSGGSDGGGGADTENSGCTFGVITVENVYEGVDIQSSNHIITGIKARDVSLSPLKIVHAAQDNNIGFVNADNTGGPVVVFSGTTTANIAPENNIIGQVVGAKVGSMTVTGSTKYGVSFAGPSATHKPNNNKVLSVTIEDSPSMLHTVLDEAGLKNKVLDVSGEGTTSVCNVDSGQLALEHVDIRKSPKSLVNAYRSSNVLYTDSSDIVWDTARENLYTELNTSTGIFTSVAPMRGRISATVRTASLGAGEYMGLDIVQDGTVIATSRHNNDSGGGREAIVTISSNFSLDNRGETLKIRFRTSVAGGVTLTGNSALTTLSIEEL